MERKLASIQRIVNIEPIPNADRIEKATILGWECVVQKGEFSVDELVIYIETDSVLPERKEFEFMRDRKFRVKTIKLRKQISQGLVFPLSILPSKRFGRYKEGDDVTEILGITKYLSPSEKEEERRANISHNRIKKFLKKYKWYRRWFLPKRTKGFPKFIRKTDEDRIQLFPNICEEHKDTPLYISEKMDGQSATYALLREKKGVITKYNFIVCSRNIYLRTEIKNNNYWKMANKYNIKEVLKDIIDDNQFVIIQSENCGPGIQDNKYHLEEVDMFVFNLIFPPYRFCDPKIAKNEILKYYNIKHVPILGMDWKLKDTIHDSIEAAKGKSLIYNIPREGIVCRNYEKNLSFKIINPDFLLKFGG